MTKDNESEIGYITLVAMLIASLTALFSTSYLQNELRFPIILAMFFGTLLGIDIGILSLALIKLIKGGT